MRQASNGTGNENSQPAAEPDRVVEVAEKSNGSTGSTEKKMSTKEPKTAAAMRSSQKAKMKENIEQKMLSLLAEDRDKEEDEIELAFASIAKRAKVELTQKLKYKFIDAVNALYAKFSSGEAMAPPPPKPTQGPDQYLFAGGMIPSNPVLPVAVSGTDSQVLNEFSFANI